MDKPTVIQIASLFLGLELKEENVISWRIHNNKIEIKLNNDHGQPFVYTFGLMAIWPAKDNSETNFDY